MTICAARSGLECDCLVCVDARRDALRDIRTDARREVDSR